MNVLAISGSLRAQSSNSEVLRALQILAPEDIRVTMCESLRHLPPFNPDLDLEPALVPVADFRAQLRNAQAVVICSPEYAHGVVGSLKNALDWVVGSGEFMEKPVALINAAPRATIAIDALAETLRTMMGRIVPAASIALPVQGSKLTAGEIAGHPEFGPALRLALDALCAEAQRLGEASVLTNS